MWRTIGVYKSKEDSVVWFVFSGDKISESGRTHKREREEEEEKGRRRGGINLKKRAGRRSVQEEVTPQCCSAAQLLIGFVNLT